MLRTGLDKTLVNDGDSDDDLVYSRSTSVSPVAHGSMALHEPYPGYLRDLAELQSPAEEEAQALNKLCDDLMHPETKRIKVTAYLREIPATANFIKILTKALFNDNLIELDLSNLPLTDRHADWIAQIFQFAQRNAQVILHNTNISTAKINELGTRLPHIAIHYCSCVSRPQLFSGDAGIGAQLTSPLPSPGSNSTRSTSTASGASPATSPSHSAVRADIMGPKPRG